MKLILLSLMLALNTVAADIQVFFSPDGGCTEAVVENVGKAQSSILVQAYSFTSAPIARALVDASMRGVKVEVILDKSNRTEKYSGAD
jgi:phosphatidylserine/phosphatidylglycerophosphate/cardiolipin synthase-like enzyme